MRRWARGPGRWAAGRSKSSLSFPPILLALFLVAIIGAGARGAVIAIGLGAAPGFARLAENFATSVGSREFIASAKATGVGRARLMQRYLLPNMAEPLVLAGLAYVAGAIIDISGLDFLGLGVQPPAYDWGTLLTAGVQSIYVTPFAGIAPAFMIMLTGTSLVFFGEALSRALNPRLWVTGPRRGGRAERARAGRAGKAGLAGPAAARPAPATGAADPRLPRRLTPWWLTRWWLIPCVADAVVVENLRITLPSGGGPRTLVDGVSFRLRAGETLAILGESGCGESGTTAQAIMGKLLPSRWGHGRQDRLRRGGRDLAAGPVRKVREVCGTEIAMIFQDPLSALNPVFRVGEQVADGAAPEARVSREGAPPPRSTVRRVRHPQRRAARMRRLPAPVLRRHASAGRDRDGDRARAEAADRGRADHGAGRDGAGADDARCWRPAAPGGDGDGARQRTTSVWSRRYAERGAMMYAGPDRGDRCDPGEHVRPPGTPVHQGPAGVDPRGGRVGEVAASTIKVEVTTEALARRRAGVRVQPALPVRDRPVGRGAGADAADAAGDGRVGGHQAACHLSRGESTHPCLDAGTTPLLSVRDLKVAYPIRSSFLQRKIGEADAAVDGVTFDIRPGETGRSGRRVGIRQVDEVARGRDRPGQVRDAGRAGSSSKGKDEIARFSAAAHGAVRREGMRMCMQDP